MSVDMTKQDSPYEEHEHTAEAKSNFESNMASRESLKGPSKGNVVNVNYMGLNLTKISE